MPAPSKTQGCPHSWTDSMLSRAALLGDAAYYRRFGFELSTAYQITPPRPEWQPHFQVRVLTKYQPRYAARSPTPEPFDRT